MKKLSQTIAVILSVLFITSCGGDGKGTNAEKDNNEENETEVVNAQTDTTGCDCSELSQKLDSYGDVIENHSHVFYLNDKKYTGRCFTLQNDRKSNKEIKNFKNGMLDGLYMKWHENKKVHIKTNLIYGLENGIYEEYSDKGNLISKINFKNGIPFGFNYCTNKELGMPLFSLNGSNNLSISNLNRKYQHNNFLNQGSSFKINIDPDFGVFYYGNYGKFGGESFKIRCLSKEKTGKYSEKIISDFVDSIIIVCKNNGMNFKISGFSVGDYSIQVNANGSIYANGNNQYGVSLYSDNPIELFSTIHIKLLDKIKNSNFIIFSDDMEKIYQYCKNGQNNSSKQTEQINQNYGDGAVYDEN